MNKKVFTEEERKNIVEKFREMNKENFQYLTTSILNKILFNDGEVHFSYETANVLADLIESAPAEKNMQAISLADKIESEIGKDHSLTYIIESILNIDHNSTYDEAACELCNVLRNIDVSEKGFPWPVDKNGVPIKLGETIYYDGNTYKVEAIKVNICEEDISYAVIIDVDGVSFPIRPIAITHSKPRTVNDIVKEMQDAFNHDLLRIDLIQEAYELGKKAVNNNE